MFPMFNPWLILGAVLLLISTYLGAHHLGYNEGYAKSQQENAERVAKANEEARATETIVVSKVAQTSVKLRKDQSNAEQKVEKIKSDVDTGAIRLSIPVAQACVHTAADAPAPSGDIGSQRAELDRQTADALISLAAEGDSAIRKHAACVQAYNEVKSQLELKK